MPSTAPKLAKLDIDKIKRGLDDTVKSVIDTVKAELVSSVQEVVSNGSTSMVSTVCNSMRAAKNEIREDLGRVLKTKDPQAETMRGKRKAVFCFF
jgi:hypothetical protein